MTHVPSSAESSRPSRFTLRRQRAGGGARVTVLVFMNCSIFAYSMTSIQLSHGGVQLVKIGTKQSHWNFLCKGSSLVMYIVPKSLLFIFEIPIFTSHMWLMAEFTVLQSNESMMWTSDLEYEYKIVRFSRISAWPNRPIFSTLFWECWINAEKKPSRFILFSI